MFRHLCFLLFFTRLIWADTPYVLYPVDVSQRGLGVVSMVNTLLSTPYATNGSEVAIQTSTTIPFPYAPYVVNGIIPYVQSIASASNNTLLIVAYQPIGTNVQYLVVPVEQIIAILYSPKKILTSTAFTSTYASGYVVQTSVDLIQRASDIQGVVTTLLTASPYKTQASTVGLQTTLSGSYYPPISTTTGLIQNVQSVTLVSGNSGLLLVSYLSPKRISGTIVIAAEQVEEVIYYPTPQ
ncbi:MAG: hypothetical protein KGJ02_02130 [Verrucomicrobiota bacterium]|nr:hypothetical protein [Verrucomicrobiota bacterium]